MELIVVVGGGDNKMTHDSCDKEVDFSWLIGGPQGSGVESGANIFSKVCARMGYQIFGKREFYSNIKGEHSYFVVRVSTSKIGSNVNQVDLLTSFDAETIFRHFDEVKSGGVIIYDSALEDVVSDRVLTLDDHFKQRLHSVLSQAGKDVYSIKSVLEVASEQYGVKLLPVSFKSILAELAQEQNNPRLKNLIRMFNVIGVSLSAGLLGLPPAVLFDSIGSIFSKKPQIAQLNQAAANYAYNFATAKFPRFDVCLGGAAGDTASMESCTTRVRDDGGGDDDILVQGYEGTSLGKIVAGCRFQSYYPITPASDESVYLESHQILKMCGGDTDEDGDDGDDNHHDNNSKKQQEHESGSTAVIQTEDEISAIGMMIGAALTGTRASTSTSGPGFALMAEALGWAGINEVPVVVTLYQRSGPSTGLPTRHGQDDLLFAVNAGHGDFPKLVYASGDVEESFYDTCHCFNYADIFQLPVVHMMDKFLASSVVTCKRFDPGAVKIQRGKLLEKINSDVVAYKRFALSGGGGGGDNNNDDDSYQYYDNSFSKDSNDNDIISPRARLGMENGVFWNTGDESDELGHVTEDPILRVKMMDKRMSKLELALKTIPLDQQVVFYGMREGSIVHITTPNTFDFTIISWGSTKGPIIDGIRMLKRETGVNVGFIQIKLVHPFPTAQVLSLLGDTKTIIDIEANYSAQLGKIFKEHTTKTIDYYILKYTGRAMTSTEICNSLKKIIQNKAKQREVLMHGA